MRSTWVRPDTLPAADGERLLGKAMEHEYRFADLLRRPGVGLRHHDEVAQRGRHRLSGGGGFT